MAAITSRQGLTDYCLRRLGAPVLEINVDVDQVEDRVDDTLLLYKEFHGDGSIRNYREYLVTQEDVDNRYITLPEPVIHVVNMFPLSSSWISSNNMFSFKYQFALSDFHMIGQMAGGLDYYYQTMQYLNMLDMTLNGTPQITFQRRGNRLFLWGDFQDEDVVAGDYIMLQTFEAVDPEAFTTIYNDMFIRNYLTASIKWQWGQNMSKFEGMTLPGGVTISGQTMKEEAAQEMETLRERMRSEQELPADFFIG